MEKMDGNGFTLVYIPWDDLKGRPRVAGRFKTIEEKNKFLDWLYDFEYNKLNNFALEIFHKVIY